MANKYIGNIEHNKRTERNKRNECNEHEHNARSEINDSAMCNERFKRNAPEEGNKRDVPNVREGHNEYYLRNRQKPWPIG